MGNKVLFFFLAILFSSTITAQTTFHIKGAIVDIPDTASNVIVLEKYYADDFYFVDADTCTESGSFSFKLQQPDRGQYQIRFLNTRLSQDFIVSAIDTSLSITASFSKGNLANVVLEESKENLLYQNLLAINNELSDSTARVIGQKRWVDRFDPNRRTKYDSIDLAMSVVVSFYNEKIRRLKNEFPGSFTGDVLADFSYTPSRFGDTANGRKYDNEDAFMHKHYLDNIDFANEEVLRHKALKDLLYMYSISFHEDNPAGINKYTDHLMSITPIHEIVRSFLYAYLIKKYVFDKNEAALNYLLTNYEQGCSDDDAVINTKSMTEILSKSSIGTQLPNLVFADEQARQVSLSEYAADNTLTIIFVWKSTCEHCRDFFPQLNALHDKYSAKRLGIYAISIDQEYMNWTAFLKNEKKNFVNVHADEVGLIQIMATIPLISTPTILLVDNENRVVKRMIDKNMLEGVLKQLLN